MMARGSRVKRLRMVSKCFLVVWVYLKCACPKCVVGVTIMPIVWLRPLVDPYVLPVVGSVEMDLALTYLVPQLFTMLLTALATARALT